jgi:hypothetical protein
MRAAPPFSNAAPIKREPNTNFTANIKMCQTNAHQFSNINPSNTFRSVEGPSTPSKKPQMLAKPYFQRGLELGQSRTRESRQPRRQPIEVELERRAQLEFSAIL